MWNAARGNGAGPIFREVLSRGDAVPALRYRSRFSFPLGCDLSPAAVVRLLRNVALHRRDPRGIHLRLEKGRSGVGALMFSAETEARFKHLLSIYPRKRSALVPMLLLAQAERGYITAEAIEYIAQSLELSPSDVESTLSFY